MHRARGQTHTQGHREGGCSSLAALVIEGPRARLRRLAVGRKHLKQEIKGSSRRVEGGCPTLVASFTEGPRACLRRLGLRRNSPNKGSACLPGIAEEMGGTYQGHTVVLLTIKQGLRGREVWVRSRASCLTFGLRREGASTPLPLRQSGRNAPCLKHR